jgi:hypothetical protein
MEDSSDKFDIHFYSLVSSLHMAAMQQMGKIASPITGKIERDLRQAETTIAMLDMLKNKTEGNLTREEAQLVDRFLYELRMNYVDEAKKKEEPPEKKPTPEPDAPQAEKVTGPTDDSSPSEEGDGSEAPDEESPK